jgi:hypothetical protein
VRNQQRKRGTHIVNLSQSLLGMKSSCDDSDNTSLQNELGSDLGSVPVSIASPHQHNVDARPAYPSSDDLSPSERPLPPDFRPSTYSVLIGKGQDVSNSPGIQRLRLLGAQVITKYRDTKSRREKTLILDRLLETTKAACPVGAFIRSVGRNAWVEVSDLVARQKIGSILRNLAHDRYRSSAPSKQNARWTRRLEEGGGELLEDTVGVMPTASSSDDSGRINPAAHMRSLTNADINLQMGQVMQQPLSPAQLARLPSQSSMESLQLVAEQKQLQALIFPNQFLQQENNTASAQSQHFTNNLTQVLGRTIPVFAQASTDDLLSATPTMAMDLDQHFDPQLEPTPIREPTPTNDEQLGASIILQPSVSALPSYVSIAEAVASQGRRINEPSWQSNQMITNAMLEHSIPVGVPISRGLDQGATIGNADDPWTLMSIPFQAFASYGNDPDNIRRDPSCDNNDDVKMTSRSLPPGKQG